MSSYLAGNEKYATRNSPPDFAGKKRVRISPDSSVFALPIFPGSHPPSIVGANELNFCVQDGREPERRQRRSQARA